MCVRGEREKTVDEVLVKERRIKDRTPPLTSGTASWRFLVGRCRYHMTTLNEAILSRIAYVIRGLG